MARVKGIGAGLSGSVGDLTFVSTPNGTYARQKYPAHNKSQSYAQTHRRVQFRNILNLWHNFDKQLCPTFEDRRPGSRNYNAFIGANIGIVPVYLTKDEGRSGGCVVAGYQITRGSLPEIHQGTGTGNVPITDIALGGLTLGPTTTVKQFSDAVCENNDGNFQHLDRIVCFHCTQLVNAESGIPRVRIVAEEVTLDRSDDATLLYDVCSEMCFGATDGMLGAQAPLDGAIAWVHSRMENDKHRVSTQRLCETNSLLSHYQSDEQLQTAIDSYRNN